MYDIFYGLVIGTIYVGNLKIIKQFVSGKFS